MRPGSLLVFIGGPLAGWASRGFAAGRMMAGAVLGCGMLPCGKAESARLRQIVASRGKKVIC